MHCPAWASPALALSARASFELTVDGEVTDAILAQAREAAETLLSNPVIEDVVNVEVVEA